MIKRSLSEGECCLPTVNCPLCNKPALQIAGEYPGYKYPTKFEILDCSDCKLQFANPLTSDPELYDIIYRQPAVVAGYDRYHGFAQDAAKHTDPLNFLAASMEPYWAVRQSLLDVPTGATILDIGSGLGYLTYALVRAGYKATGLDISAEAVANANARYGNYYKAGNMFEWSARNADSYDVITMLEVIEHVEDPIHWIESAFRMVKPGGKLIISTPNRDFYVAGSVWATEAPPLHLWWFSPQSFRKLTEGIEAEIEFIDFQTCNFKPAQPYSNEPVVTFRRPGLNAKGRPSALKRLLAPVGLLPMAKAIWVYLYGPKDTGLSHPNPGTRETLAVVLKKPS